jgi:hypothetical protein
VRDFQGVGAELGAVALRTSPGAAASVLTLNQLVAILTAIFLALQIGHLAWKWWRDWKTSQVVKP